SAQSAAAEQKHRSVSAQPSSSTGASPENPRLANGRLTSDTTARLTTSTIIKWYSNVVSSSPTIAVTPTRDPSPDTPGSHVGAWGSGIVYDVAMGRAVITTSEDPDAP